MQPISSTADTATLAHALEQNLWSMWSNFGYGDDCDFHQMHGATLLETPLRTFPYNMVMHFNDGDEPNSQMDRIFERYQQRGVPFLWLISPSSGPPELEQMLVSRGYAEAENLPGMAAPLAQIISAPSRLDPSLDLQEFQTGQEDTLHNLLTWRWGVPPEEHAAIFDLMKGFRPGTEGAPVRVWIAWQDGVAVSKSVLHIGGGVAGVYGVVTRPEARGMGAGWAVTQSAFRAARASGCKVGVLHSSTMAQPMYEKMGFKQIAPFRLFAPPDAFHL